MVGARYWCGEFYFRGYGMKTLRIPFYVILQICIIFSSCNKKPSLKQEGTVLDNKVYIRSAPSLNYSQIVGVVNKNDKLNILSYTSDIDKIDGFNEPWYEVKFNDLDNCYIYGGYFKPDFDNLDIYETNKLSEMGYILWHLIDGSSSSAINVCDNSLFKIYYRDSQTKYDDKENGKTIFEYLSFRIIGYWGNDWFRWELIELISDINNPLNIKLGISDTELREIFGCGVKFNEWFTFGRACAAIRLDVSDGVLNSILFSVLED